MARLQEYYRNTITNQLIDQFKYKSVMEVPRIAKITLNIGLGEATTDKKIIEHALLDMKKICGQQPIVTKARGRILSAGCPT